MNGEGRCPQSFAKGPGGTHRYSLVVGNLFGEVSTLLLSVRYGLLEPGLGVPVVPIVSLRYPVSLPNVAGKFEGGEASDRNAPVTNSTPTFTAPIPPPPKPAVAFACYHFAPLRRAGVVSRRAERRPAVPVATSCARADYRPSLGIARWGQRRNTFIAWPGDGSGLHLPV